jgi:signal transduction histidine kinase
VPAGVFVPTAAIRRGLGVLGLAAVLAVPAQAAGWLAWLGGEARRLEERAAAVEAELEVLGSPTLGQTVAEFGYQHPRLSAPPLVPAWVQVDLGEARTLDAVALIPAQVDWRSGDRRAYGLPRRFRLDVSDDPEFVEFQPYAVYSEDGDAVDDIAPLVFSAGSVNARYVRLTVTEMAQDAGQHFYALAELLVLAGARNVAAGRPLTASATSNHAPRWTLANLTDGRTPLGPPVRRELLAWDGYYVEPDDGGTAVVDLDLSESFSLEEVRLHGVHARIGADIPGFSFPTRFRVLASEDAAFADATVLFSADAFPNPGNNAVTVSVTDVQARYVRVVADNIDPSQERRFGLSEIEVYAGGLNVARGASVRTRPDRFLNPTWPASLLVDGYASFGRLIEWPEWLADWRRRARLEQERAELSARRVELAQAKARDLTVAAGAAALLAVAGFVAGGFVARRRRERELERLRLRFARDLHDEIGSNLAGLAVLSEAARDEAGQGSAAADKEMWNEVHRIADETLGAMREVLWVSGARSEEAAPLAMHLRRAGDRMLAGREVAWNLDPKAWPGGEDPGRARHVFLFFKETLANVVRHSEARRVEISLQAAGRDTILTVADNGVGFDPATVRRGLGLGSLASRARELGADLAIEARPGAGTRVVLVVPVDAGPSRRER